MFGARTVLLCAVLITLIFLSGCRSPGPLTAAEYNVGDKVQLGPLVYNVIEAEWKSQLGEFPSLRMPERSFLIIRLVVTNGGGESIMIPQTKLENSNGETFQELTDGAGLPNWLGLLRSLKPAGTERGEILFDVPANSYRLRLTDGSDAEHAPVAYVRIPLSFDGGLGQK
jgi:Domain of unknown function (DUF4352)